MLADGLEFLKKKEYEKAVEAFKEEKGYAPLMEYLIEYCNVRMLPLLDISDAMETYHKKLDDVLFFIRYTEDEELQDRLMSIVGKQYVDSMRCIVEAFIFAYMDISKDYRALIKKHDKEVDMHYSDMRFLYERTMPVLCKNAYHAGDVMYEHFGGRYKEFIAGAWMVGVYADAYGGDKFSSGMRDDYCHKIREWNSRFEIPEFVDFAFEIDSAKRIVEASRKKVVYEEEKIPENSFDLGLVTRGYLAGTYIQLPKPFCAWTSGYKLALLVLLVLASVLLGIYILAFLVKQIIWLVEMG